MITLDYDYNTKINTHVCSDSAVEDVKNYIKTAYNADPESVRVMEKAGWDAGGSIYVGGQVITVGPLKMLLQHFCYFCGAIRRAERHHTTGHWHIGSWRHNVVLDDTDFREVSEEIAKHEKMYDDAEEDDYAAHLARVKRNKEKV